MDILSTVFDTGNPSVFTFFITSMEPILITYVIPAILSLGVIKIIQIISRNVKDYFDKTVVEDKTTTSAAPDNKRRAL